MKRITIFILMMLSTTMIAQTEDDKFIATFKGIRGGTTLEEYNYITKGYKIQMESGLDMKKGYKFKEIASNKYGNSTIDLKALYRDTSNQACAVMCIITLTYTIGSDRTYYYCIPNQNSSNDIWKLYGNSIYNENSSLLQGLSWALAKSTAYFMRKE